MPTAGSDPLLANCRTAAAASPHEAEVSVGTDGVVALGEKQRSESAGLALALLAS